MKDTTLAQVRSLINDAQKLATQLADEEPSNPQDRCDLFTLRRYLFWCGKRVAIMEARS